MAPFREVLRCPAVSRRDTRDCGHVGMYENEHGLFTVRTVLMTAWNPLFRILVRNSFNEHEMTEHAPYIHTITASGSTALHFAALRKDTRFLQFLSEQGVLIEKTNYYKETALHWAVKSGHAEAVSFLVSLGARVDALDSEEKSPLDWAMEEGHMHLLPLLSPKRKKASFLRSLSSPLARTLTLTPLALS